MTIHARIAELERRHDAAEKELHEAMQHPSVEDDKIHEIKRRKLGYRDEIERLRAETVH